METAAANSRHGRLERVTGKLQLPVAATNFTRFRLAPETLESSAFGGAQPRPYRAIAVLKSEAVGASRWLFAALLEAWKKMDDLLMR